MILAILALATVVTAVPVQHMHHQHQHPDQHHITLAEIEKELAQLIQQQQAGTATKRNAFTDDLLNDLKQLGAQLGLQAVQSSSQILGHLLTGLDTAPAGTTTKRNAFTDDLLNDLKQLGTQLGLQAVQSSSQILGHLLTGLNSAAAQPGTKRALNGHHGHMDQHHTSLVELEKELAALLHKEHQLAHNLNVRNIWDDLGHTVVDALKPVATTALQTAEQTLLQSLLG